MLESNQGAEGDEKLDIEKEYKWGLTYHPDYILSGPEFAVGWLVVDSDGTYRKHIREAKEDLESGVDNLWSYLAPLKFFSYDDDRDEFKLYRDTELYHKEKKAYVKAEKLNISEVEDDSYTPWVLFSVEGTNEYIKLYADDIEDMLRQGKLMTPEEVHDNIMDKLES